MDVGSSFAPSEITAAFLFAQLEHEAEITRSRLRLWDRYHVAFAALERRERVRRPIVPSHCQQNGHLYYLLLPTRADRDRLLVRLAELDINAVFHYVPLHSSEAGRRFGRAQGDLPHTDDLSGRLLRLPLWADMTNADVDRVVAAVEGAL